MRISRGCRGALDDNDTVVGEGRQVMKFGVMGIPRIMISMRCKKKFAEPKYQSKRFSLGLFVRDESRCSNIFYDSLQAESQFQHSRLSATLCDRKASQAFLALLPRLRWRPSSSPCRKKERPSPLPKAGQ